MREEQKRAYKWGEEVFEGMPHWKDPLERGRRFLEEAMELAQVVGVSREDAEQLAKYVWGRPVGELPQEIGGVMHTLMVLAEVMGENVKSCLDEESTRVETPEMRKKIREKQVSKHLHGIGGTVPRKIDPRCQKGDHDWYEPVGSHGLTQRCSREGCPEGIDYANEVLCNFNPEIAAKKDRMTGMSAVFGAAYGKVSEPSEEEAEFDAHEAVARRI